MTVSTFPIFLGSDDVDSVFIGGPINSPIIKTMIQDNPNYIFNTQLGTLEPEIKISDARFVYTESADGFQLNDISPYIEVTNNGPSSPYTQRRHVSGSEVVDYALIFRLAVTLGSTQETKSIIYIAGINKIGTEVAAYCLKYPEKYHLGRSSGCLVVIKYPASFDPYTEDYIPESTPGSIKVVALSDVVQNNVESD
jgi:hypothetical protein